MTDASTTVEEPRELVEGFVHERDWEQFHLQKNLAMAIAIESAELMEHYQWAPAEASGHLEPGVAEELADVLIYCLAFANRTETDISTTVRAKLAKNAQKYPVDLYRGRATRAAQ